MAHEITGVKVAQKTWHKLLDERQHATESSHIASTKEIVEDTAKTANSKVHEFFKGLNDKHSKFKIEQGNVTDTPQCVISTIDHGEQIDHRNTGKGKSKHTGKGKGKHVDVVETNQLSETASTMLANVGGDADESMDMVRPEAEEAQNTLTAEMLSGSLSTTTLTSTTNFLMSLLFPWNRRSKSRRKISLECKLTIMSCRSGFHEHNEITKTMKDLSIIQR